MIGQPHYEVIGRYGVHETVLTRVAASVSPAELNEIITAHRGEYPVIVYNYRPF